MYVQFANSGRLLSFANKTKYLLLWISGTDLLHLKNIYKKKGEQKFPNISLYLHAQ